MAGKSTGFHFFYQKGEKTTWKSALEEDMPRVVQEKRPELVTILTLNNLTPDEKTKYKGDLYLDWDGNLEDALRDSKRLVQHLVEDFSVDPESLKIHLTGGRGVHLEIPYQLFDDQGSKGRENLPLIYREMVNQFGMVAGVTVDFNIYSMGKGRMWRVPNIRRTNGAYKVPISYADFLEIDPVSYKVFCSSEKDAPPLHIPSQTNLDLASLFQVASSSVQEKLKLNTPTRTQTLLKLHTLKGSLPNEALKLLSGSEIREDVGLNAIAIQLGLFALALGVTLPEYLEGLRDWAKLRASKPFGKSHKTEREILNELKRIYNYLNNNPLMSYSLGGARSVMTEAGGDLLQLVSLAADGYNTSSQEEIDSGAAIDTYGDMAQQILSTHGRTLLKDKGKEGASKGALFPAEILPLSVTAYYGSTEVNNREVYVSFKYRNKDNVVKQCEAFIPSVHGVNANTYNVFCTAELGLSFPQVSDPVAFYNYLYSLACANGHTDSQHRQLNTEGLHTIIKNQGQDEGDVDFESMYLAYIGCGREKNKVSDQNCTHFHEHYQTNAPINPEYGSCKVLDSKHLSLVDAELIENLMNLNGSKFFMGCILGWVFAAMARDTFTLINGNFPILMLVGQAGAGKSETAKLLLALFSPREGTLINAGGATPTGIQLSMESSMSYPTVIDEYKPSDLHKDKKEALANLFNICFGRKSVVLRAGGQSRTNNWRTQDKLYYNSPLMVLGETLMQDSSHRERMIFATALKSGTYGRQEVLDYLTEHKLKLHRIGAQVIRFYLADSVKKLQERVKGNRQSLGSKFEGTPSRVLTNIAVVLTGLEILRDALRPVFGDKFDEQIQSMQDAVANPLNHTNRMVTSESTQALRVLFQAAASKGTAADFLRGKHFIITEDHLYLDIDIGLTYTVYHLNAAQQHRLHYSSTEALFAGLKSDEYCLPFDPRTSPLSKKGVEQILRFNYPALVNNLNLSLL